MVRFALCALLHQEPGLEIVGEAAHAEDLLAQVEDTGPDIILLDWALNGRDTDRLLAELWKLCPMAYVIVLSGRPEERLAALAAGADLFVSKIDPPDQLLAAIRSVQNVEAALVDLTASLETL
jgi:DNA-binding NarL/FixJ family response regulator